MTNIAYLEHTIISGIASIGHVDYFVCMNLVIGENFDVLLSKLGAVFAQVIRNKALKEKFEPILVELHRVNVERNKYIHSTWFLDNPKENRIKFTRGKRTKPYQQEPNTSKPEELEQLAEDIAAINKKLWDFLAFDFLGSPRE